MYNKELQKKKGVNIEDYKKASGKWRIIEENGKGREYDLNTNELLFEGEYSNGKKNGKVKEYYYSDILKFKGEYLNGKKWNGKGYNKTLHAEYEIKDGNGYIKEYFDNGKLEFEREYSNGERNGKVKEYK